MALFNRIVVHLEPGAVWWYHDDHGVRISLINTAPTAMHVDIETSPTASVMPTTVTRVVGVPLIPDGPRAIRLRE